MLTPGELLDDRYRLVAPLGEGGQGEVWRAADVLRPGTHVALKLLHLPEARPVDLDRLRREAHALAGLRHPSLIACHRLFEDLRRGVLGLALELVEGAPLSSARMDPRFSPALAAAALRHVAEALAALHAAGVVHRDVKPDNVLVAAAFFQRPADPATVKLVDLGIAAPAGNPQPLTDVGTVIGTAAYLAPELIDPSSWPAPPHGPARDVFAFGVMAMELLRGAHPTRLVPGAGIGRYAMAYRSYAGRPEAWPPGIEGDPWEPVFRGCLALRAAERAPDGRAVVVLLDLVQPRSSLPPSRTEPVSRDSMRLVAPVVSRTLPEPEPRTSSLIPAVPGRAAISPRPRRVWLLGSAAAIPLAFLIAFAAARGSSEDEEDPPPLTFSEPPTATNTPTPPRAPAPAATPPATTLPLVTPADPPSVGRCPVDMELIGTGRSCLDRAAVTVAQFERFGELPESADWPGASLDEKEKQTRLCNGGRPWRRQLPANCVDWVSSRDYCQNQGKRLPARGELQSGFEASRVSTGHTYEWTSDPSAPEHAFTCSPGGGCAQQNPETARNSDLGFRCAADPS